MSIIRQMDGTLSPKEEQTIDAHSLFVISCHSKLLSYMFLFWLVMSLFSNSIDNSIEKWATEFQTYLQLRRGQMMPGYWELTEVDNYKKGGGELLVPFE